ncbi:MAG TPA: hypothetical protein VJ022_03150, partial [Anaerolineales bacterium]|nr:hypothetical protein [Anaerolineales bacterium]
GGSVAEGGRIGVLVSVGGSDVDDGVALGNANVGDGVSVRGEDVEETVATVSMGGSGVNVAGNGSGGGVCAGLIQNNKNRNIKKRMIATINLKRS